jgi:hypothetical protein
VTLHFLNNVFRLNLALEPAQGILNRLTFLQSNFCQLIASKPCYTSKFTLVRTTHAVLTSAIRFAKPLLYSFVRSKEQGSHFHFVKR